jgi:hypothetical protein
MTILLASPFYLMVVHNFHIRWAIIGPLKTNPVPIINPYTMLTFPVAAQGFQAVAGRNTELIQPFYGI